MCLQDSTSTWEKDSSGTARGSVAIAAPDVNSVATEDQGENKSLVGDDGGSCG